MIYSKKGRSNALASFAQPSRGAPTSFAENFAISSQQENLNESTRGYEAMYGEYTDANLRKVYELTGKKLSPPRALIASRSQQNQTQASIQRQREEYEKTLTDLKAQYPEIQTPSEIQARVRQNAAALEQEMFDVTGRQTTGGKIGEFAGAIVGSFNPETNPFNVATLPIGIGAGKVILTTLLKEFGFNAAMETINQFTGVAANRKQLGLSNTSERMLMNIAAAGVGGAALRGVGMGAYAGVQKLHTKYGNQPINKPASQLLDEFESSGSAADNAVEFALQREALEEPLTDGATPQTMAVHQRKIDEVESAFAEGRPIDDDVFPEYNPDRVIDDLYQGADEFDDLSEDILRISEIDESNISKADIKELTGKKVDSLKEFVQKQEARIRELNQKQRQLRAEKEIKIKGLLADVKLQKTGDIDTEAPDFQKWFSGSKVSSGEKPKAVYHGTATGGFESFNTYGSNYGLMGTGSYFTESANIAFEYTAKGAKKLQKKNKKINKTIYSTYLNIKNPLDMDAVADLKKWQKQFSSFFTKQEFESEFAGRQPTNEEVYRFIEDVMSDNDLVDWEAAEILQDALRVMGYDGITHIGGGRVKGSTEKHRVWIAFDPDQIKINNRTRLEVDLEPPKKISAEEQLEIDKTEIKKSVFNAGYFPEKNKFSDISDKELADTIQSEDFGVMRFPSGELDDALSAVRAAKNDVAEKEARVFEAIQREDALLEAYENTEIAYLERDLREIEAGAPENRSITLERTDGQMENIKLTEVLDELKADRAVLDSMKVCGI
jgi:TolA-binding protein